MKRNIPLCQKGLLLARQDGKILQAVTWAKQSLAWLPQEDRTWRTLSLTVVGIGEIFDGSLERAHELLLEALTLSKQQGNLSYARATRGMLSWASLEQGELHHTAEQFRQMQSIYRKLNVNSRFEAGTVANRLELI